MIIHLEAGKLTTARPRAQQDHWRWVHKAPTERRNKNQTICGKTEKNVANFFQFFVERGKKSPEEETLRSAMREELKKLSEQFGENKILWKVRFQIEFLEKKARKVKWRERERESMGRERVAEGESKREKKVKKRLKRCWKILSLPLFLSVFLSRSFSQRSEIED